jgi:hypothetical protein
MYARRKTVSYSRPRAEQSPIGRRYDGHIRHNSPLTSLNRIRCFVESSDVSIIPRIDGVEYVADAEDDFDVFIVPDAETTVHLRISLRVAAVPPRR